jgi:nitroreductase
MSEQLEVKSKTRTQSEKSSISLFDAIKNRRATRGYLPKPVSEHAINGLIDFAVQDPSAVNQQPWSFVVVQNSALLKEISEDTKKRLLNNTEFFPMEPRR